MTAATLAKPSQGALLLRRWMTTTGTTMAELSGGVGARKQLIRAWLTGMHGPSVTYAVALAKYTKGGVPVESWA